MDKCKPLINLVITRGLKKLGHGKYISISRFRKLKGLPPSPSACGPLTDDPDWSYIDGRPGTMNIGQTKRYQRDQEFAESIVEFNKTFKAIAEMRKQREQEKIEN